MLLQRTPRIRGAPATSVSSMFPNEPSGYTPIWTFDPDHPDGLAQAGTTVYNNLTGPGGVKGLSIVDATWRAGKALRSTLFASVRGSITNWQTISGGPYDGWTQITAAGFGTAYNACFYRHGTVNNYPGTLTVLGVNAPLGNFVNNGFLYGLGGSIHPEVLDADNVAAPFDSSSLPAYTGGGTIGLAGGIGTFSMAPSANSQLALCTLYNTGMYFDVETFVPTGYAGHRNAGSKQFFYGIPVFANFGCYGPLGGVAADNQGDELTGPLGIGWGWSADNGIGGGSNHGAIGCGYTDGHLSYDWPNTSRPDYIIRGTKIRSELLFEGDSRGSATDARVQMWLNKTALSAPDYIRSGFKFSEGNFGFGGFGPAGFNPMELADTDGGGGMLPAGDKIVEFGPLRVSGGYVRPGDAPSHWDVSLSDPGGSLPRTVKATFTLKSATGPIRAPVNNTPSRLGGTWDDPDVDLQFRSTNGANWSVDPYSFGYQLPLTGEALHGSTVPGASYDTAREGPIQSYVVKFGAPIVGESLHGSTVPGASYNTALEGPIVAYTIKFGGSAGVEGVDFSVDPNGLVATINILPGTIKTGAVTIDYTQRGLEGTDFSVTQSQCYSVDTPVPATIDILPGTTKTGAVTLDYQPLGAMFLQTGQIAIDVNVVNPGHTAIEIQSFPRANNNQRVGPAITGSTGVDV